MLVCVSWSLCGLGIVSFSIIIKWAKNEYLSGNNVKALRYRKLAWLYLMIPMVSGAVILLYGFVARFG